MELDASPTASPISRTEGGGDRNCSSSRSGRGQRFPGEKDFGKEAINTLVKHMENERGNFILILAGYEKEINNFLSLNPGLESRFPLIIKFLDYTVDQLMDIAQQMMKERDYIFSKEAAWKLREHLIHPKNNPKSSPSVTGDM